MTSKPSIQQFNSQLRALIHAATKSKETKDLIAVQASLQRYADQLAGRIAQRTSEKLCPTMLNAPSTRR